MTYKVPTFADTKRLTRYIKVEDRKDDRRVKPTAFMLDEQDADGLSINSLEVQTEKQIAQIYSSKFQSDLGGVHRVAISTHRVADYIEAVELIPTAVTRSEDGSRLLYTRGGAADDAFLHNPKAGNNSHCLMRCTRSLSRNAELRFAKKMAYKPRFKVMTA